jgi:poly-gamma-glutamate capsule biosynthesis protein CapA/YwtB (metallophosphatase superfamily)
MPVNSFSGLTSIDDQGGYYYLRDGSVPYDLNRLINIVIVGDVMLGRNILNDHQPFKNVSRELSTADLTVGNFEGAIGSPTESNFEFGQFSKDIPILISAPPYAASELRKAGFDLISLANNHSLDHGKAGLAKTFELMERSGLEVFGAGPTRDTAFRPIYVKVKNLTFAILAANGIRMPSSGEGANPSDWQIASWDFPRLKREIQSAREKADAVIIMVHWGDEFEQWESPSQREAAVNLIKSGADVVVGSHPHVIQGTRIVPKDRFDDRIGFVAYSLGNFVFDQFDETTKTGLAMSLFFDQKGLKVVQPLFVSAGPEPRWLEDFSADDWIDRFRPEPDWISFKCSHDQCDSIEAEIPRDNGIFHAGQIDLTGDGLAEIVRLVDQRAQIFKNEKLVWESPAEWKVLDVALGDPNLDGRGEVALALEKPDSDGVTRSHPFLIGFRGGLYRQVWEVQL